MFSQLHLTRKINNMYVHMTAADKRGVQHQPKTVIVGYAHYHLIIEFLLIVYLD
jgi:glycine/serine hydroxymethyltransferase